MISFLATVILQGKVYSPSSKNRTLKNLLSFLKIIDPNQIFNTVRKYGVRVFIMDFSEYRWLENCKRKHSQVTGIIFLTYDALYI